MSKKIERINKLFLSIFIGVLSLLVVFPNIMTAQTPPVFLPEDFDFDGEEAGCICSPGVINKSPGKGLLIEYNLTTGGDFTPDEVATGISPSKVSGLGRLKMRLKVPIIIKPKTKILLGFDHFREQYNFNFVQPVFAPRLDLIRGQTLKSTRLSLYVLQSLSESDYIGVRARVSYNGDYSGLIAKDPFYRQIRFSGIWGIKNREDREWGIGLYYSESFRRNIVLPFFLYNATFNERWGIETAFPVSVLMRYNFNPRSLLLFGPELSSASYALKGEETVIEDDNYFRHTEILFGAKYERQLTSWVWASIHTGVQINFDSQYRNVSDSNDLFEPDLKTGLFLKMGIFLSPPD